MVLISVSIDVERPAGDVFAYATDPSRFSEWQKGVVSGHIESSGATQIGDRFVSTRRIGFANRPSTSTVTRFDPPHHWSVRGIDGPIRAMVDVTVEPRSPAGAQLTITLDFEGHGIGRLLVPLLVTREARREMPVNVAALKEHLEGSA
jgi:Polyketide cyclase / dehydrase and lipid transport